MRLPDWKRLQIIAVSAADVADDSGLFFHLLCLFLLLFGLAVLIMIVLDLLQIVKTFFVFC